MCRNFDFAERLAPDVAKMLNRAEELLYRENDPHSSISNAGSAMELFIRHIYKIECFVLSFGDSQWNRIIRLGGKSICPKSIIEALKYIHSRRKEATHEAKASAYDAKVCLKKAHEILCWSIKHYQLGTPPEYVDMDNYTWLLDMPQIEKLHYFQKLIKSSRG